MFEAQQKSSRSNFKKSTEYHRQIARKSRQQFMRKQREAFFQFQQQKQNQCPLNSDILSNFSELPIQKLNLYVQEIQWHLSGINGEQLSAEQTQELCHDLMELFFISDSFQLPFNFKFRKDKSILTANVVAYVSQTIDCDELAYWMGCMGEQSRQMVYMLIEPSEVGAEKWIKNQMLTEYMLLDFGLISEAESAALKILREQHFCDRDFALKVHAKLIKNITQKIDQNKKSPQILEISATVVCLMVRLMIEFIETEEQSCRVLQVHLNESMHHFNILKETLTDFDFNFLHELQCMLYQGQKRGKILIADKHFSRLMSFVLSAPLDPKGHKLILECVTTFLRTYAMFKTVPAMDLNIIKRLEVGKDHENYNSFMKLLDFLDNIKRKFISLEQRQKQMIDEESDSLRQ